MKKLIERGKRCLQVWNWKDVAALKLCICALGVLVGLVIPARRRKLAAILAGVVFAATYVPLMVKFLPFLKDEENAA